MAASRPLQTPFAKTIEARLKDLKWTKSDLARRVNVTPSRIRRLLHQSNLTEHTMQVLFTALGLQIEYREVARPEPPKPEKRPHRNMIIDGELV